MPPDCCAPVVGQLSLSAEIARGRGQCGEVKARVQAIGEAFPTAGWRIRDRSDASPSMRRFIERLGLFLTLVGLTALVVGGVGVGNAITAYLQKRRETIAVIKALGGTGRFIFRIYAVQIAALVACIALLFGLGLGARRFLCKPLVGDLIAGQIGPDPISATAYGGGRFRHIGGGGFRALAFGTCRKNTGDAGYFAARRMRKRHGPAKRYMFAAIVLCFVGLGALAMVISERRDVALWFGVGVALSYLALRGAAGAIGVFGAAAPVSPRQPELRMALSNITRPNAPVRAVMLSIGLSVTLAFRHLHGGWQYQPADQGDLPERTPSFFLWMWPPTKSTNLWRPAGDWRSAIRKRAHAAWANPGGQGRAQRRGQTASRCGMGAARRQRPDLCQLTMPPGGKLVEGEWWPPIMPVRRWFPLTPMRRAGLGLAIGDEIPSMCWAAR